MTILIKNEPSIDEPSQQRGASNRNSVLVFALGCLSFAFIDVVGQLYVVEIALAIIAAHSLTDQKFRESIPTPIKMALTLGCLWLLASILSDTLRETPASDFARGTALVAFTLTSIVGMTRVLLHRPERVVAFGLGFATSSVFGYLLQPNAHMHEFPWKFGFAAPILLTIGCLSYIQPLRRRPQLVSVILVGYALLSLVLGARAFAVLALVTAGIHFWARRPRASSGTSPTLTRAIASLALMTLAATAAGAVYSNLAASGALGDVAMEKYVAQTREGENILLAGRPEVVYGVSALSTSPIIGLGSAAPRSTDTDRVAARLYDRLGVHVDWTRSQSFGSQIPAHSHLIAAWVTAGLVATFFWFWILKFFFTSLIVQFGMVSRLGALPVLICLTQMWDVLFSPYGADRLIFLPFSLVAVVTAVYCQENTNTRRPQPIIVPSPLRVHGEFT